MPGGESIFLPQGRACINYESWLPSSHLERGAEEKPSAKTDGPEPLRAPRYPTLHPSIEKGRSIILKDNPTHPRSASEAPDIEGCATYNGGD